MKSELLRFLTAGGINTLLTLLVYQALLSVFSPELSYVTSYFLGLVYIYFVYPNKVFKVDSRKAGSVSVLVYLSSLIIGTLIISYSANERFAVFFAIAGTTIYNFLLMRFIIRRVS